MGGDISVKFSFLSGLDHALDVSSLTASSVVSPSESSRHQLALDRIKLLMMLSLALLFFVEELS